MIAEIMKNLREQHSLTQQEAANGLNMKLSTYKNYEYGRREPDLNTVVEIAKFYGISSDELLGIPPKKKADDPIVELCTKYNFGMIERAIITAYCAMDEKQRKNFMEQIGQFSEKIHNVCLEAVQTVKDEQSEEPSQPIVQEQATQEAANNTEQIADEVQQVDTAAQKKSTQQTIIQEQPPTERPVITTGIVQKAIVKPEAAARQGEVPYLEDDEHWDMVNDCSPVTKKNEFD